VTTGVAGHRVDVRGTVSRTRVRGVPARSRWRVVLEERVGRRWTARVTTKLTGAKRNAFKLRWNAPAARADANVRLRLRAGRRVLATSRVRTLKFASAPALPGAPSPGPSQGAPAPSPTPSGTSTPTPTPSPAPAPVAHSVDAEDVAQLPTPSDPRLVLSGERVLTAGEYLAARPGPGAPAGFLLKVRGARLSGGQTVVDVQPASLYEVVPTGQIDVELGDLGAATPRNADARRISRALARGAESTSVPLSELVSCSGSANLRLNGSINLSLSPHLEIDWKTVLGIPTGIEHARAGMQASLSASAMAAVSAAGECQIEPKTLLEPSWTVIVTVGPVPVPITVSVPITLSAGASAQASAAVTASASLSGELGVEYEHGDASVVKEFTPEGGVDAPSEAKASAEVKLGAGLSIEAGWKVPVLGELAVGASLDAASGLRLTWDAGRVPEAELCVPLSVTASITFEIPGADDLEAGPLTLYDGNLACRDIGRVAYRVTGTQSLTQTAVRTGRFGRPMTASSSFSWTVPGVVVSPGGWSSAPGALLTSASGHADFTNRCADGTALPSTQDISSILDPAGRVVVVWNSDGAPLLASAGGGQIRVQVSGVLREADCVFDPVAPWEGDVGHMWINTETGGPPAAEPPATVTKTATGFRISNDWTGTVSLDSGDHTTTSHVRYEFDLVKVKPPQR
jgi:hypothetical protein